jgi:hypothetical protein
MEFRPNKEGPLFGPGDKMDKMEGLRTNPNVNSAICSGTCSRSSIIEYQ